MTTALAADLEELLSVDTSALSPWQHVVHMAKLEKARTRFEAVMFRELHEFEVSTSFEVDAARTPTDWLATQTGTQRRIAGSRMNLARRLRSMPFTNAAFTDGAITEAHVRILARCVANPRTSEAFAQHEAYLVGLARGMGADEFEQEIRRWLETQDPDGTEPSDPQDDVLHASQVGERVKLDGDFGLETGLPILAALNEKNDELFRRDRAVSDANPLDGLGTRTRGNRQAEGLAELVLAGAGAGSNPRRRDPLFNVNVDPTTFALGEDLLDRRGRPTGTRQLADGTSIPLPVLLNWRCEAQVSRAWLDARGQMLSYGRDERYANRDQRRALAVRDGGCGVPGCDRPPAHCDSHHVIYWESFGPTDIDNLVLLCRHHHRSVHRGRLSIRMLDGVPAFFDVTGSRILESRHRPPDIRAA
ncbi:MAG: DUF222 domain-containing protein [Acidimicrobiales bacterium]|nr:DUF222 domain-containing protein [Acidimicrobiales bacterium]